MALEVNFYAGTRDLYDAEPSLDPGGLYALIDGLGLYRGSQPIAGPCPFDINLLIEKTTEEERLSTLEGGFQSTESVQTIKEFFEEHPGNGSRPIRVRFTYTSGTPLTHVSLNRLNLLMYNTLDFNVHDNEGLVGKYIAIEFKYKSTVEDEHIDCVMYELVLKEPDAFYMYIKEFSIIEADIPISQIVERINENSDAIANLSTNLDNEVTRAKKAEDDLSKTVSDLSDKIAESAGNIDTLTEKVDKNALDITTIQTSVSNLDKRIDNIEAGGTGGPFWVEY